MTLERRWTVQDSAELYHTQAWGEPYFGVNARGNITVRPRGKAGPEGEGEIDLKELVDDLCRRGIGAPILLRFNDILQCRVEDLADAFATSIREYGYKGSYRGVMPIKVNQQRHVVEELVRAGKARHLGLEAGSKAELLIAIALLESNGGLLVLNGYKDSEYIETALHAQKLGLNPVLVLDRFDELDLVLQLARVHNVRPNIGVRVRLSSKGAGKWQESSGERSKFGLSASELCRAVELLRQRDMLDCLKLQHFHIGSQITAIRSVKDAIREATRVYHDLRRMGAENLQFIDVGGGLAVDYDGSKTNFHSSRNYSNQEYANDIVSAIQDACDKPSDGGVPLPHPTIITEAGRALVAHHAVLVFNVVGTNEMASPRVQDELKPTPDEHEAVQAMWEALQGVTNKNFQESYNDALTLKDEAETLFAAGVIHLRARARIEDLFWAVCERVARTIESLDYVPEDLVGLKKTLSDTYYCNFSVFQSLPDSWAVDQLFPIVPLHRLDQEPTREAIIADLTCDSDGKVDMFIDLRDVKPTLRLHPLNGQPYFLGAFLVGAYQETLGDLHNLFGDTNVVHVALPDSGTGYRLEHVVEGDRVSDVLSYVEYDRNELVRRVRQTAEAAVRAGSISFEESAAFMRRYEDGLAGYTYLED
ncbi:MAG: biosynthetic arginine decarboxylase [Deltaproteobacteria bacterium]|nr:biosynthetic arginine decarboxylase [Deltaproteobacteria bacterium]